MSSRQHREFALSRKRIKEIQVPQAIKYAKEGLKSTEILSALGLVVEKETIPVSPAAKKEALDAVINPSRSCSYDHRGSYAKCTYCSSVRYYMKNKDCLSYKSE